MLYALCGVSRVGKTTILKKCLQRQPLLERLVTTTTRAPRPEEVNHVDYHFVTPQQFQEAVQIGHIVCPILYRGECYGTARDDLIACATRDALAVLRPDKINELQQFAPLLGISLSRPEHDQPVCLDDRVIMASQHVCRYRVINVPGDPDAAVTQILSIIQTHAGG